MPISVQHWPQHDTRWHHLPNVMAVIGNNPSENDPRYLYAGLPSVGDTLNEVWLYNDASLPNTNSELDSSLSIAQNTELTSSQLNEVRINSRSYPDHLWVWLHLSATELEPLANTSEMAYQTLLSHCQQLGFPHVLRIWNFLHDINSGTGDTERYKQFCLGRFNGYAAVEHDFEKHLPAATAIGLHDGGLLVYALAAKQPGVPIENPRQVSAYRYPREYGPKSPSFARALYHDGTLYISGTASVVGHASQHVDDVAAQTEETLTNIKSLLASANQQVKALDWQQPSAVKVYLREPSQQDTVATILAQQLKPASPILYLHGDICRHDLLLEIEAVYA